MLGQISGVPTPKQEKKFVSIYVCKPVVFEVQPNNVLASILQIFICGDA